MTELQKEHAIRILRVKGNCWATDPYLMCYNCAYEPRCSIRNNLTWEDILTVVTRDLIKEYGTIENAVMELLL